MYRKKYMLKVVARISMADFKEEEGLVNLPLHAIGQRLENYLQAVMKNSQIPHLSRISHNFFKMRTILLNYLLNSFFFLLG